MCTSIDSLWIQEALHTQLLLTVVVVVELLESLYCYWLLNEIGVLNSILFCFSMLICWNAFLDINWYHMFVIDPCCLIASHWSIGINSTILLIHYLIYQQFYFYIDSTSRCIWYNWTDDCCPYSTFMVSSWSDDMILTTPHCSGCML